MPDMQKKIILKQQIFSLDFNQQVFLTINPYILFFILIYSLSSTSFKTFFVWELL